MPVAVAEKLGSLTGLNVTEGYGLTETIAPSHLNPPDAPKLQRLGIPIFGVDSRIIDPETLEELGPGETGEIITHGPEVFIGYWRNEEATKQALIELDGKSFLCRKQMAAYKVPRLYDFVDALPRSGSGKVEWRKLQERERDT